MKNKILVIGGGAAGMMAAIEAAKGETEVILLEKNEKLGKKIYITGKGRCNITNASYIDEFFPNIISNPKFLYSALYGFTNEQMMDFLKENNLPLKIERGNRVFPVSDKSSDVIKVLERVCKKNNVKICLNTTVKKILIDENKKEVKGVLLADNSQIKAEKIILATGGLSYKSTGSSGDGHKFAKEVGHHITELRPGLSGMSTRESFVKKMQGLTLKNTQVWINKKGSSKRIFTGFGEVLFTHYGISGPLILTASSKVGDELKKNKLIFHMDLKPALSWEQLDKRILRDFEESKNLDIKNALIHLLPKSFIPVILDISGIDKNKKVNGITKDERKRLVDLCKDFSLEIEDLRDINEAIITRGGVDTKEINPATMESNIISGLYFAGEIIDVDGLTGGFNLQIAWSTGKLAGLSCKEKGEY